MLSTKVAGSLATDRKLVPAAYHVSEGTLRVRICQVISEILDVVSDVLRIEF